MAVNYANKVTVTGKGLHETCWICEQTFSQIIADRLEDWEYATPGRFCLIQCVGCGLARLSPTPSVELLQQAYPPHYHTYAPPASRISRWLKRTALNAQARAYAKLVPGSGRVLDVGCSDGALLEVLGKAGFSGLTGVESEESSVRRAEERPGVSVLRGFFEDVPLAQHQYDLVVMNHVLEHLFEPELGLNKAFWALKPGGVLVGEVPNLNSWDFHLFRRHWGGIHSPRHLWQFSPNNLRAALKRSGFTDIRIGASLHTGHWALSVQNLWRSLLGGSRTGMPAREWYHPFLLIFFVPVNIIQFFFTTTGIVKFHARKSD